MLDCGLATHKFCGGGSFTNRGRQLLSVSPDGTRIVYVANQRLYLRPLSEWKARPIAGTESMTGVTNPVFSPDGRSVVFYSGNTLKRVSVTGGAATTVCQAEPTFGISWTEDTVLFGQSGKGIMRVSANGGVPAVLVAIKNSEIVYSPQLLPGGEYVLLTVADGADSNWDRARIVGQSLKSGERKTLIEGGSDGRYLPTGHIVYALRETLLAVPFDLTTRQVRGVPISLLEGVLRGYSTGTAQFSVSETGSLVYIPGPATIASDTKLAWVDRAGHVEPLPLPAGLYEYPPRLAPDGRRVAYDTDNNGKDAVVWIAEISGTRAPLRLTFGGRNRVPVWSPDGVRVAFQSDHDGDSAIWWRRADGTGAAERLTTPEPGASHVPESWSPDGKTLLFDVMKGSDFSLWSLTMLDRKVAPVVAVHSNFEPTAATFSPDGRWIAYFTSPGGLFVQSFPPTGPPYQIVTPGGVHPLWSPDGRELFFYNGPWSLMVVTVSPPPALSFTVPAPMPSGGAYDHTPYGQRNMDMAPDGKRFLAVVPSGASQTDSIEPQIALVENWFEELKTRAPTK
jgi:serine/threonine-protein kinase